MSHDSKSNDANGFAEAYRGNANRIQGNASECGEASTFEWNLGRDARDQIAGGHDYFAMPGSLATVGNAVTDLEIAYRGVLGDHDARSRIPEHCIFTKLGAHFGK